MRIVVLDGYTLNPGDLDWTGLQRLGDCRIYDRTGEDEVVLRADGAEVVLTNKTTMTRAHLQRLPALKYIGVLATGFNIVEVVAARERNVVVTNVPAYGTRSVAQMTLALLLELTQHVGDHAKTVQDGRWTRSPDFCYWDHPLIELDGLTLGVVGFGRIGQSVAALALAFGMKVLVHTRSQTGSLGSQMSAASLTDLFTQSDAVSLHCPLTPETKHMVNVERLSLMKPTAFLVNTSRGPLIDEPALANALESGQIAGAALDVLSVEPPLAQNPLLSAKNCLITPHIAWATRAARSRLMETAITNVRTFLEGKPQNVVN